jgi:hypothetical protein
MLRNLLLGAVFLYWLMGLVSMAAFLSPAATKTLWGSTSVAVLGVYYVAPLSSVAKVIAERDSSSLHWPLCMMNIINGMLWFAYGLALKDWFVCLPVSLWARRKQSPCKGSRGCFQPWAAGVDSKQSMCKRGRQAPKQQQGTTSSALHRQCVHDLQHLLL